MTLAYDDAIVYDTGDYLYDGEEVPEVLLVIAGQRAEHLLTSQTVRVTDQVEERTVCRFHLADDEGLELEKGMPVHIRWQGDRLFDGVIDVPTEGAINRGVVGWDVTCIDWHYLTDRRNLSAGFDATTAGDIVRWVVDQLEPDGVSAGTIEDGPTVTEAAFAWVPATRILDRAAEASGFTWYLDGRKQLHFHKRGTVLAPWTLDDPDLLVSPTVKNRNPDHRTRQIIRGGKATTDPQSEQFVADGTQATFVIGFPLATQPTITEDSVAQVVGVKGFGEEGARWLWARGSAEITLAEGEIPPASSVVVQVDYTGLYDLVMVATDQAEKVRVQELEGFGTGLVDHVETDTSITSVTQAAERAGALLSRYARPARELTFDTDQPGLKAGQLLTIQLSPQRLDTTALVTQVVTRDKPGRLLYQVTCVDGPAAGSWARFFARLADKGDPLAFRENVSEQETVIILESTAESTGWTETTDETVLACDTAADRTFPMSETAYDDPIGYDDPVVYEGVVTGGRPTVC